MKLNHQVILFAKRVLIVILSLVLVTPAPTFAVQEVKTVSVPAISNSIVSDILLATSARSEVRSDLNWTPMSIDEFPEGIKTVLGARNLDLIDASYAPLIEATGVKPFTGGLSELIAFAIAQIQAISAAQHSGLSEDVVRFPDADLAKILKKELDGNSVSFADEFLDRLANFYDVRLIIIGNEGATRDGSAAIPIFKMYNSNGKNGTLLFLNDAVEGTNYNFKGKRGAWSLAAVLAPDNAYSTDGYRASVNYRSKRAADINPVITGENTVRNVLTAIAASDDQTFEEWAKIHHVILLGDRKRHEDHIAQLRQLTANGLTFSEVPDGDAVPRILQATFGTKTNDSREVVVIDAGGANEHAISLVAAKLSQPDQSGRKGRAVSSRITHSGLKDDLANAYAFSQDELKEIADSNEAISSNQLPVRTIDATVEALSIVETEDSIKGPAAIAAAAITGARRADLERYQNELNPVRFIQNQDGSGIVVVDSFLVNEAGTPYLFKLKFSTPDLFQTRLAFLANNPFHPDKSILYPQIDAVQNIIDDITNYRFELDRSDRELKNDFETFREHLMGLGGFVTVSEQNELAAHINSVSRAMAKPTQTIVQNVFLRVAKNVAEKIMGVPTVDGVPLIQSARSESREQGPYFNFQLEISNDQRLGSSNKNWTWEAAPLRMDLKTTLAAFRGFLQEAASRESNDKVFGFLSGEFSKENWNELFGNPELIIYGPRQINKKTFKKTRLVGIGIPAKNGGVYHIIMLDRQANPNVFEEYLTLLLSKRTGVSLNFELLRDVHHLSHEVAAIEMGGTFNNRVVLKVTFSGNKTSARSESRETGVSRDAAPDFDASDVRATAEWLKTFFAADERNFQESLDPARSEIRSGTLHIKTGVTEEFPDVYTPEALNALNALAGFNADQKRLMRERIERRTRRIQNKERITFLDPNSYIGGTQIKVQDARDGKFEGSEIPADLKRQWIQGTGPAAKPREPLEKSIRNVAYALLSGADGWMFDGEDAAPHTENMSLENQRNLKLAIAKDPVFLKVAKQVAEEMVQQGFKDKSFLENDNWYKQLDFTTKIFRARGLHLDDRHVRDAEGEAMSASIVDVALYVVNNYRRLLDAGSSVVLYLPKIQTAEEAALWNNILSALEDHLAKTDPRVKRGMIKTYVLIEQVEATFQLMEIRAALGKHFVGFNTGRWDYINSVSDAMSWNSDFINPNIEPITMTYAYMRAYEDRVRRAVNTPDRNGNFALWQGGMEANIPVGSKEGVDAAMAKATAGAEREQREGASGKWVSHWKMVPIIRPVWEKAGQANQLGREFPRLTYTQADADALFALEDAPRTIRGARNLISVGLQYGNAFLRGYQAAALKAADFFGDDNVLYLMEDMATGEIRLSILWEWLHKGGKITEDDPALGVKAGDMFTPELFARLLDEEYQKLLKANNKDVHDDSKTTTLPIALEIVKAYVNSPAKNPWYIDFLNINLDVTNLDVAKQRIAQYQKAFAKDGTRITENLDFSRTEALDTEGAEFKRQISETEKWMASDRFNGITRLHTAAQVVRQRGDISRVYDIATKAATGFYSLLRGLFGQGEQIQTFGPYNGNQAIMMKRAGIKGIYLGGWATSAKGSIEEPRGPDLASYPLSQVPEEAKAIVRSLLTEDQNQSFARKKMTGVKRVATQDGIVDYSPFIIADADTGHGGDPHVRNLIRRFVEAGVPGYHIEDQVPGCKKCGHQGGKVLEPLHEQVTRLNTARFQLDVMNVPGIVVARTDAEDASLIRTNSDERDHAFILGATNISVPPYRLIVLALLKKFYDGGIKSVNGHLKYGFSEAEFEIANRWIANQDGLETAIQNAIQGIDLKDTTETSLEYQLNVAANQTNQLWEKAADLTTYPKAVANGIEARIARGQNVGITVEEWLKFANRASNQEARAKAQQYGVDVAWDWELARTPEGYYQIASGIEMAIVHGLAMAPFADLVWMETKTANLKEAAHFAHAIHAVYPDKMLAYNLSPSFNWDLTGMTDDEMSAFTKELGKLGFVFNFITYAGHQFDGVASQEFATAYQQEGPLALAKLQRRIRGLKSPYEFPQTFVGGPRSDAALDASHGRGTVTTQAMGAKSTEKQHRKAVELPTSTLDNWLTTWAQVNEFTNGPLTAELLFAGSFDSKQVLNVFDKDKNRIGSIAFRYKVARSGKRILEIEDQETAELWRQKRLSTLMQLFLINRFNVASIHYLEPTEPNQKSARRLATPEVGIFVNTSEDQQGNIMAADVNPERVKQLVSDDQARNDLITKVDFTNGETSSDTKRSELRTPEQQAAAAEEFLGKSNKTAYARLSSDDISAIVSQAVQEGSDANQFLSSLASLARNGVKLNLSIADQADAASINRAIDDFFAKTYGADNRSKWQAWRGNIQINVVNENVGYGSLSRLLKLFNAGFITDYEEAEKAAFALGGAPVIPDDASWNGRSVVRVKDHKLAAAGKFLLASLLYQDTPDAFYRAGGISILNQTQVEQLASVLELMIQTTKRLATAA